MAWHSGECVVIDFLDHHDNYVIESEDLQDIEFKVYEYYLAMEFRVHLGQTIYKNYIF